MSTARFEELYEGYCDGTLTEPEQAEFLRLLEDPACRAQLVRQRSAAFDAASRLPQPTITTNPSCFHGRNRSITSSTGTSVRHHSRRRMFVRRIRPPKRAMQAT